jgi:hypothetical protein
MKKNLRKFFLNGQMYLNVLKLFTNGKIYKSASTNKIELKFMENYKEDEENDR